MDELLQSATRDVIHEACQYLCITHVAFYTSRCVSGYWRQRADERLRDLPLR